MVCFNMRRSLDGPRGEAKREIDPPTVANRWRALAGSAGQRTGKEPPRRGRSGVVPVPVVFSCCLGESAPVRARLPEINR